jgi:hypothetical protein
MPYFSWKPSIWPWPNMGSPGMVTISTQAPKYCPLAELLHGGRSSGLFMKLTKRFSTSGLNSSTFLMVWRYLAFSSFFSMFMKALL